MRRIRQEQQIFKRDHHLNELFNNNDESEEKGAKKRKKKSNKKKKKQYDDACAVGEYGKTDEKNSLNDIPKSATTPSFSLEINAAENEGQRSTRKIQKYGHHHAEEVIYQVEQKKKKHRQKKMKKMKKEQKQQKLDQPGVERAPDDVNIVHHDDTDVKKKVEKEDGKISLVSLAVATGESIISKESKNYDSHNTDNEILSKAEQKKRKRELKKIKRRMDNKNVISQGVERAPGNFNIDEENYGVHTLCRQYEKKSAMKRRKKNKQHHSDEETAEERKVSLGSLGVTVDEINLPEESNTYVHCNTDNELMSKAEQKKRKRELKINKKKRKRQKLEQSGVDKVPGNVNIGENNHDVRISYRQYKRKFLQKWHKVKKQHHDNADTEKTVGEEERVSLHSLAILEDRSRLSKERDGYGHQDKHDEIVLKTEGNKRKCEQAVVPSSEGQTAGHNNRNSSQRVDEKLLPKTKRKELERKRKEFKKELVDEELLLKNKRKELKLKRKEFKKELVDEDLLPKNKRKELKRKRKEFKKELKRKSKEYKKELKRKRKEYKKELKRKRKEFKKELRRQKEQWNEGRVDCPLTDCENQKKGMRNDNQLLKKKMADVKAKTVLFSSDASENFADAICTSHSHQKRSDVEYEVAINDAKDDELLQKDGLGSNEIITTPIVFPNSSKTKSVPADNWMTKFQDLQQYKAEYGACNVPKCYAPNKRLATWVRSQRQRFKRGTMTPEQVNLLVSEGFIFRTRGESPWANMFNQLKAYNAEHGNCNVPRNFPSNPKLGIWVRDQRMAKKGQKTHVSESQLQALEAEGFVWKLRTLTPWAVRFEQLLQYKAKFGDCLVPRNYDKNVQLGQWVGTQRAAHKAWARGRPSPLSKERREALQNVGFVWRANLNYSRNDEITLGIDDYSADNMCSSSGSALCCSSISILPSTTDNQSQDNSKWLTKLNELRQYRETIGNCFVPRSFPANPQLANWVFTQKKLYRSWQKGESTSMTLERIRALEAEGFYWKYR